MSESFTRDKFEGLHDPYGANGQAQNVTPTGVFTATGDPDGVQRRMGDFHHVGLGATGIGRVSAKHKHYSHSSAAS